MRVSSLVGVVLWMSQISACGARNGLDLNDTGGPGGGNETPGPRLAMAGNSDMAYASALSTRGAVTSWGGTRFSSSSVFGEYAPPPPGSYADIVLTPMHACGILAEATLRCWGHETLPYVPDGHFTSFVRGYGGLCAFRPDRGVSCLNYQTGPRETDGPFDAYSASHGAECGQRTGEPLRCRDVGTNSPLPHPFPTRRWVEVIVGPLTLCALDDAGEAFCARLESGSYALVARRSDVSTMALGFSEACAVKRDRSVECWPIGNDVASEGPGPGSYDAIAVGFYSGCAARTDGTVRCWGRDDYGQASPPADLDLR